MTRFTFDPAIDISAIWTPDGSHIIFASNRSGKFELYQKASTGAGVDELLLDIPGQALPQALTLMENISSLLAAHQKQK
jgi:Tol biopolymer transport system component